jgi:hypothetical protein
LKKKTANLPPGVGHEETAEWLEEELYSFAEGEVYDNSEEPEHPHNLGQLADEDEWETQAGLKRKYEAGILTVMGVDEAAVEEYVNDYQDVEENPQVENLESNNPETKQEKAIREKPDWGCYEKVKQVIFEALQKLQDEHDNNSNQNQMSVD